MDRIFKYELVPGEPRQMIMMPACAKLLSVKEQRELPFLFALVDDEAPLEPRIIRTVTTGEIFNSEGCEYVDTVFLGGGKPEAAWFTMHVWDQDVITGKPDPINPRFQEDYADLKKELVDDPA